jgi:ABC-type antimicrobial peptide transport system permease subunit
MLCRTSLKSPSTSTAARHAFSNTRHAALSMSPVFPPEWTVAVFVFAIVACLIFSLYPAKKASKLEPCDGAAVRVGA